MGDLGKLSIRGFLGKISEQGLFQRSLWEISTSSLSEVSIQDLYKQGLCQRSLWEISASSLSEVSIQDL